MAKNEFQQEINEAYLKAFGRTPLRQRLDDIFGEAIELSRYTDLKNLREETGDLLGSVIQLVNECGWTLGDLVAENIAKIEHRQQQYRSLGRKIKVAILGGAFDPITVGHIQVAQFVLNTSRSFDEVWLMPCLSHIYNKDLVPAEHRVAMCKLAVRNDARIKVFEYEIEKKLRGETYHMVKQLLEEPFAKEQYDFSLIIGQDNANSFHKWVNYQDLERMVRFVVVPRNGVEADTTVNWYLKPPHIYLVGEKPLIECASTTIRQAIYTLVHVDHTEGIPESIQGLIDPFVYEYIWEHKLYQD